MPKPTTTTSRLRRYPSISGTYIGRRQSSFGSNRASRLQFTATTTRERSFAESTSSIEHRRWLRKPSRGPARSDARVSISPLSWCRHMASVLLRRSRDACALDSTRCVQTGLTGGLLNGIPSRRSRVGGRLIGLGGLPVIPRFHVVASDLEDVVFRAFLGQPLILYAHHTDLKAGLDLLAARADYVRSLGVNSWQSLGRIADDVVSTYRCGDCVTITLYSRRAVFAIPEGVTHIQFVLPGSDPSETVLRLEIRDAARPA